MEEVVVLRVVLVVVRHGEVAERLEEHRAGHADVRRGAEGVGEDGRAPLGAVAKAVQELERGRGGEVEQIHVEGEFLVGVSGFFR